MFKALDPEAIKKELDRSSSDTSVYLGCDSQRGKYQTSFALVVGIHDRIKGGVSVYGKRWQVKGVMPMQQRLLEEMSHTIDLYCKLEDVIENFPIEVHFDVNPNLEHRSSSVMKTVTGMAQGLGLPYKVKPDAAMASSAADWLLKKAA